MKLAKAILLVVMLLGGCAREARVPSAPAPAHGSEGKVVMSEADWKQKLTPEQFHVLREKGTERAFTGAYWDAHEDAVYLCAGCGQPLFDSHDKFDSGTGWPSFTRPAASGAVADHTDMSYGMARTEVVCSRCGGHLGHVFDDGPEPTGLRYCINSLSLKQQPR